MKSRFISTFLLMVLAGLGGWLLRSFHSSTGPVSATASARKVRFYQSPMHPWIKSDKPGRCTICGMDLVPVMEGDSELGSDVGVIRLGPHSINALNVQTVRVQRKTLVRTLRLAGQIDDNDARHRVLSAYTDARLEKLFVNFVGAEVRMGQPLALIYSPSLLSAVREYMTLSNNTTRSDNGAALVPLRSAAISRLLQLGLLPHQIEQLPATFTETNLAVEILAPMDGTVVSRDVYEGQMVVSGQKLMELADFTTMWVQFEAYEQDLPWLQIGQSVEVSSPALPGQVWTNQIRFIDPNLNKDTRTTRVRIELPNPWVDSSGSPQRLIRHRIQALGRVYTELSGRLVLPRSAILDAGQPKVFVELSDGNYEPREVLLGMRGDADTEVLSGVVEGESVVVEAGLLLDAQYQLQFAGQAKHLSQTVTNSVVVWSTDQLHALKEYFIIADQVRESLSADALAEFNNLIPKLIGSSERLMRVLGTHISDSVSLEKILKTGRLTIAPDLATARKQFHEWSESLVQIAPVLKRDSPQFSSLKIYQCPMTLKAFPGAPARASWMQFSGPIRNPYFGAEMLDCGTEVKP